MGRSADPTADELAKAGAALVDELTAMAEAADCGGLQEAAGHYRRAAWWLSTAGRAIDRELGRLSLASGSRPGETR